MPTYSLEQRALTLTTPLGPDALLPTEFEAAEIISRPFRFDVGMVALNTTKVPFELLLGQPVSIGLRLPSGEYRPFTGYCSRLSQSLRDFEFTYYQMEVVPQFWFLTLRAQSRIFQQISVPDILKKVLEGLDVTYELRGTYAPRDYCVQYRETDFAFASRLMEEEGIFYFCRHTTRGHTLVVSDGPHGFLDLKSPVLFEELTGEDRADDRVYSWLKTQEVRPGKVTLWDHCFEVPHKHLEAEATLPGPIAVGQVEHPLKVARNERLELYDYPGQYAQRFDGVDPMGGDRPDDLRKLFDDNQRTTKLRMQEQTTPAIAVEGSGTCHELKVGHRFQLQRHFNADGRYVLTRVFHEARMDAHYRSNADESRWSFSSSFTCIPADLPYRPARTTPKPTIHGTQTAVVVGPGGEEIFTDKYGRVKVQFHWDREGRNDQNSSCWVRVTQPMAGRRWGSSFWPRIGQEVVVGFEEGDPDRPLIVGSVYNADQMPPYLGQGPDKKHPNDNKLMGIKSNTTKGGSGYNELRLDDTKGKEQVFIHGQRDMDVRIENDSREYVLANRHMIVGPGTGQPGDQRELVTRDKHINVKRHQHERVEGDMFLTVSGQPGGNQDVVIAKDRKEAIGQDDHLMVAGNRNEQVGKSLSLIVGGDRFERVGGDDHVHVKGNRNEQVDASQSVTIRADHQEHVGGKHAVEAMREIHLKAGMKVILEAGVQLTIKGPGGFVDIGPSGVTIQGIMVLINSGGAAGVGSGSNPTAPQDGASPKKAQPAQPIAPDQADNSVTGDRSNIY